MSAHADLAAAADENLAAHFTWVQGRTRGMRASVGEDLVLTECGMPCDTFNAVCRVAPRAGGGFGAHPGGDRVVRGPPVLLVGRTGRRARGPRCAAVRRGPLGRRIGGRDGGRPVPAARRSRPRRAASTSAGSRTPGELADYARDQRGQLDTARSPPRPLLRARGAACFSRARRPLRMYVGYADGEAVATCELTVAGGVAGLYGISTLAAHRHRGYGSAMTAHALLEARRGRDLEGGAPGLGRRPRRLRENRIREVRRDHGIQAGGDA